MSYSKELNKHIQRKHPICEISTVMADNNRYFGHAVHFYVFVSNRLNYVISTYKEASASRMKRENTVMMSLKNQVRSQAFMDSLLFSFEILCIDDEYFRVQGFVASQDLRKVFRKKSLKAIEKYLNVSFDWLSSFQGIRKKQNASHDELVKEIEEITHILSEEHTGRRWLNELINSVSIHHWELTKGFSHGDFCFYNCLYNGCDRFLVFDWEHVSEFYWLFYDPILNVNSVWQYFFERGRVKSMYDVLILKRNEKKFEVLLSKYVDLISGKYRLSLKQFLLLSVFVFFRNQTREGKSGVIATKAPYIDINGVLSF
ncbi:hypothetical protein [Marinilabilia rubra]|uniref:Uncharacterized protein n=1 Tax=Marinilabilia rubra TaxID=2162893 RepID=A0A2U2B4L4_9BACT|nr:hypothetical protein [Marinilabilia rubra]PWD98010.1 hypothetical protein DDZ16_17560 [Marinilabilia rubra]